MHLGFNIKKFREHVGPLEVMYYCKVWAFCYLWHLKNFEEKIYFKALAKQNMHFIMKFI